MDECQACNVSLPPYLFSICMYRLHSVGNFLCAYRTIAIALLNSSGLAVWTEKKQVQQDAFTWNFTLRNYKTSVIQIPVRLNWTKITYFTLRPQCSYNKYIWPLNVAYFAPCRYDFMPNNVIKLETHLQHLIFIAYT